MMTASMVNVHPHIPAPDPAGGRFNVLLTEDRVHPQEHWTRQLPRLMEPMGVRAYVARCGEEALEMTTRIRIHAAVVDLATPRTAELRTAATAEAGGLWLLKVLSRQPGHPPVIVVNNRALTPMQVHKFLHEALRMGAFTVVNRPNHMEALLVAIRRVLDRHFNGAWPGDPPPQSPPTRN